MPQFQISSTPISASTINGAMRRGGSSTLSLNDRFCRIFTRSGFNTGIAFSSFLNVPGFDLQAGTSINVFVVNSVQAGSDARIDVPISNNFPGITGGDAFSLVVGAGTLGHGVGFYTNSPVTHHGYTYGSAGSHVLANGGGNKIWFTRTVYDGGNNVSIDGFYSGSSTNFPFATMFLLALRFAVNQTGYAAGDGNGVSGGQTGFTIDSYVGNFPFNFNIADSIFIPDPPDPGPDPAPDPGGGGIGCFLADALVTMADGSLRRIDQVLVGDQVLGGRGHINNVLGYHRIPLGDSPMYVINNRHCTSAGHKHWTTSGWAAMDINSADKSGYVEINVDNDNNTAVRYNTKFVNGTTTTKLEIGMTILTQDGYEKVERIDIDDKLKSDDLVYALVTDGSHSHFCNAFLVSAWATDIDFDYDTWSAIPLINHQ